MVRCASYNCTGVGKSLFRFPTNAALLKRWLVNMKREDFRPTKHSRLCQDHFEPTSFERNPEILKMTGVSLKLTLKSDAIPTKFCFGEPKMKSQQKGRRSYLAAKLQPRLSPRKSSPKMLRRVGGAYEKRRRQEVLNVHSS